ncbi:hypothetical protein CY34DRAFT_810697 [Suillus luteus UH-Slu-Lm8-n1]|uniref:Uncharacterized protein n=1 Tax=Suillus luteus UH-Slu-Lm8-n1 TaxID=930992 RepID=A0A0C9ZI67_9AGAM|nr:hypothetical protein CY34DRAFT_810697 [Suillus luteus UH-Slu-Lm8-n1]
MNANLLPVVQANSKQAKLLGTVRSIRTAHCTSPANWKATDMWTTSQCLQMIIASCVRTFRLVQAQVAGRLEDTPMVDLSRVMVGN